MLLKFEKSVRDLKENEEKFKKEIEILKKENKIINEKFTENEILLNT